MKVLVYGSGVIGCYLAHVLCAAGSDVTLLARGEWKEQLQQNGLKIRHHLQRKTTLDHPRVIGGIEEDDTYDAVFAVMPYNKMRSILEPLAAVHAPIVVLVGNNSGRSWIIRCATSRCCSAFRPPRANGIMKRAC